MTDAQRSITEIRTRREELRLRMVDVEDAAARPGAHDPDAWWKGLHEHVRELADAWDHHVAATERPDGFLDEVVAHAPQLARRRAELERDHVEIAAALREVLDHEGPGGDGAAWVDGMREHLLALLGALVRHRHKGAEFTYDAYNVDLSSGD